jgi:hypothetical protein
MIKNFIIGLSLIALGVIVVGSLDAARTAAPNFAVPNGGSLINEQRALRQVGWQQELALSQVGRARLQPARMPTLGAKN